MNILDLILCYITTCAGYIYFLILPRGIMAIFYTVWVCTLSLVDYI
jgi:hypothetical protein